ncbi:MAG: hypothetical protein HQM10_26435 [Candidatus Riflebacteria bacterium]|nr:hypothetical protein [Candidatus Riflebacteria bacterium]
MSGKLLFSSVVFSVRNFLHSGRSSAKKSGFTVMELMMGFGILSALMLGVLAIYRSGTESFLIGTWKVNAQKKAQLFLSQLREDFEKANNPFELATASANFPTASTPIYLNVDAFSDVEASTFKKKNLDSAGWTPLVFLTVSKPLCIANILNNNVQTSGKWIGVSLWASKNKIRYIRTGSPGIFTSVPDAKPTSITNFLPNGSTVAAGGDWEPGTDNIFDREIIEDVRNISFMQKTRNIDGKNRFIIQTRIQMQRFKSGNPTETTFTEDSDAKIQEWTAIQAF